jgi:hypothetical protein
MAENQKKIDHLYAVLFRESKLILSNYENYLREKLTSKQLAEKMLSLRDAIKRIEEENKNI